MGREAIDDDCVVQSSILASQCIAYAFFACEITPPFFRRRGAASASRPCAERSRARGRKSSGGVALGVGTAPILGEVLAPITRVQTAIDICAYRSEVASCDAQPNSGFYRLSGIRDTNRPGARRSDAADPRLDLVPAIESLATDGRLCVNAPGLYAVHDNLLYTQGAWAQSPSFEWAPSVAGIFVVFGRFSMGGDARLFRVNCQASRRCKQSRNDFAFSRADVRDADKQVDLQATHLRQGSRN